MATLKLTDRAVEGVKARSGERLELWDSHTPGLCLRVSASKKAWAVRYRADGTQRRYVFADHPSMRLADARIEAAVILRNASKAGADPAGDRKRGKADAKAQPIKTFNDLAKRYMAACRNGEWMPRGKRQSARTLKDADGCLNQTHPAGDRRAQAGGRLPDRGS